jgi:TolB-like protein
VRARHALDEEIGMSCDRAPSSVTLAILIATALVHAPLHAENTPESARQRLLVLDAVGTDIDQSLLTTTTELLTVELSRRSELEVLSGADIRRMIALEAERVSVGCDLDASCLAEVAGALGARYVVSSTVGRLATLTVITLSLFDASEGRAVSREVVEVTSPELLPSLLRQGAANLVAGFLGTARVETHAPVLKSSTPSSAPLPAPSRSASNDLTLRDVIVIVGRVGIAAGIGIMALGALSFCGGYSGAVFGTWISREKSEGDLLIVAIPVAGPLINLARNGITQYDVTDIIALVSATLFQSAGIAVLFAGGICGGAGGFMVGFDDTVAGVVDNSEETPAATSGHKNGGSVGGAMAMVF